jgi:hypothetical protein
MKLDTVTVSGFVKNISASSRIAIGVAEKRVFVFFGSKLYDFFTSFTNPCQAFDLLHRTKMQMV